MSAEQLSKLRSTLKYFKLQDLCDLASHEFPEFTWTELQNRLIDDNISISKKSVIEVIGNIVVEAGLHDTEIERRCSILALIAVAKGNTKTWWTYLLKDEIEQPDSTEEIEETLKNVLSRNSILSDIKCIRFASQYVLSVKKKIRVKRTGGIRVQSLIYFKIFLDYPYLFSSRPSVDKVIIGSVSESLGYTSAQPYNLKGKNVLSLLEILRNREGQAFSGQAILGPATLLSTYRETPNGLDFSQQANRADYAQQLFGKTPPQLESFAISIKEAVWAPTDGFEEMNGESLVDVMVTFRSDNTIETIKELIKRNLVVFPLPQYMQRILYGKNTMKISQAPSNE